MFKTIFNPVCRVALGLVGLTVSVLLLAAFFKLIPDHHAELAKKRQTLCESIAISFSSMANRIDRNSMEQHFTTIVERNTDLESIGLRTSDGQEMLQAGEHFANWQLKNATESDHLQIAVPIFGRDGRWGNVEFKFKGTQYYGISRFFQRTEFVLSLFVATVGFVVFYVYLGYILRILNPSKVIPRRVRDALDTLAEGLVVIDKKERIVLANKALQDATGQSQDSLIGTQASSLQFNGQSLNKSGNSNLWRKVLSDGSPVRGQLMTTDGKDDNQSTFLINCAPIVDENGKNRGAIASFEDVTQLEQKKVELEQMLVDLDESTTEIKRQNRELEFLATRDPLTSCMNRRSFFELFDKCFAECRANSQPLSAFMVDIDHFKSINDNHGHAVGDEVLKSVASTLESTVRESDIVCRYGGEEFSILLPNTTIGDAANVAEAIRRTLEELVPAGIKVTASLGVSALCQNPTSPQDLLEHADKCLYVAKRNGRNQVVRWDNVPDDVEIDESQVSRTEEEQQEIYGEFQSSIPFHAVTALISALAYRDQETANHCRRVADLCVAVAEGLLPMKDCYTLEIAGLLHDIGKIGVPDSILLKPDALTTEEWQQMKLHERIGVELIRTSFSCEPLDEIVSNYRVTHRKRIEENRNTPVGSRILCVADAYDSMITDKSYRKGLTREEAFQELRKCAGEQFDPAIVEKLIQVISIRGDDFSSNQHQLSKAAALNIGLQIERLAEALDNHDREGINAIASRLKETATKHGADSIAMQAEEIALELKEDCELYELISCTNRLIDLCRSSQRALIDCEIHASSVVN